MAYKRRHPGIRVDPASRAQETPISVWRLARFAPGAGDGNLAVPTVVADDPVTACLKRDVLEQGAGRIAAGRAGH